MYFSRRGATLSRPSPTVTDPSEVSTLLTYAWKNLFALCHSRERGGKGPRNVACNDLKRWGGTCRAHNERYRNGFTVFPIPFEYREFLGRESGSLPTKFDHLSSLQREREQSPLARIVATFRQWEPRIPRLKRSLVSSSSYNVAFSTTSRRTANNSLGCFQPSPSSTGLKRTP